MPRSRPFGIVTKDRGDNMERLIDLPPKTHERVMGSVSAAAAYEIRQLLAMAVILLAVMATICAARIKTRSLIRIASVPRKLRIQMR